VGLSFVNQVDDVIVIQRIVSHLAASPVFHKAERSQKAQVVGDSRRGHLKDIGKIAHAKFLLREKVNYGGPGLIAKNLKHFRKTGYVDERFSQFRGFLIGAESVAYVAVPGMSACIVQSISPLYN